MLVGVICLGRSCLAFGERERERDRGRAEDRNERQVCCPSPKFAERATSAQRTAACCPPERARGVVVLEHNLSVTMYRRWKECSNTGGKAGSTSRPEPTNSFRRPTLLRANACRPVYVLVKNGHIFIKRQRCLWVPVPDQQFPASTAAALQRVSCGYYRECR